MNVAVLGAGTWGTALSQVLTDNGHDVYLYARKKEVVEELNTNHTNTAYFSKDIILSARIHASCSLSEVVQKARILIFCVPTLSLKSLLKEIAPLLKQKVILVNTAKGFDPDKKQRLSEMIREEIPQEMRSAIISLIGPGHAEEVIQRQLTVVTATGQSLYYNRYIQKLFSTSYFRVYTNQDEIGAEYGVAIKNAIAIASGILEGLGYGDNARAALVTRGLHEMVRFGKHFGGKTKTYLGLTGLGDLMVTCNSHHSRNFLAGVQIAKENGATSFLQSPHATTEGIKTVETVHQIAQEHQIYMPIVQAIYEVLYQNAAPRDVIQLLMVRPLKKEED